jgi:3-deoxy-D-manno-octulosonic-acid transferase
MLFRFVYSLLLFIIAPFFLYKLYKTKTNKPKFGKRWQEHFGLTPILSSTSKPIWIHTVSVGEVIAATPLIKSLKQRYPNKTVVVTTTTSTGAVEVEKMGSLVEHRYMPLDFSCSIKRFIKIINPTALLIIETELWPNTLHYCKKNNIPVTVINARLSEKSSRNYEKFSSLFHAMANNIDLILCQATEDAERFIALGVETQKVKVTGSIKFDISIPIEILQAGQDLRDQIGNQRPVWIAASTHKGEDEIIIAAHKQLLMSYPDALLILVPRHPERFFMVEKLCLEKGFSTVNRTSQANILASTEIYIGNTMGEMLTLIKASDICFMGGSLIGDKVGGHNLLEPAALARACLIGPSYFNFQKITEALVANGACRVCSTAEEIATDLKQLFADNNMLNMMAEAALQIVNKNKGAIQATINELEL